MPLTLTLTEDVLPEGKEKEAIRRLTKVMLELHGLTDNKVMTPNVTANVSIVPRGYSFSGGEEFAGAWIEWKVPSFAFADRDIQKVFGRACTDIIMDLSGGRQPRDHIYFNVVHTVDGAWNLDGEAMTNAELGSALDGG
jgi:hypothetical protein